MSPAHIDVSAGVLDTSEAADYLHVSEGTLRYWRQQGTGPPSFKLGPRKVAYLRSELDKWVQDRINASLQNGKH